MTLTDFLSRLEGVTGSGGHYKARCPAHRDSTPSLSVSLGRDRRILVKCFAGCQTEDVVSAMGLTMKDLFDDVTPEDAFPNYGEPQKKDAWKEAEFIYPGGQFKKVKMRRGDGSKYCFWQHRNGADWVPKRGDRKDMLYYHEPLQSPILLVEGERDVDTLHNAGFCAATLPDGSKSKWFDSYGPVFSGKHVFIIQDNDNPGKEFAQRMAEEIVKLASSVRVLDLSQVWPEIPEKGDVSDLIAHFGQERGLELLARLMSETKQWAPEKDENKPALICAADVPYEPPRWLISPYFQRGKGTLIQGDNGTGKTAFMCAVAAHVSTGEPLLGLAVETPGDVILLSVEDDMPILRGRIEADGGDLRRCHFMTNAAGLTFNSPEVEAAIKQVKARLIVFDPIQAFLGAEVDMFRSNETRPKLAKLFEMCAREDCACAIISHTAKASGDKSPVNRSIGSVDIPAAMRSIMHLIRNPDDEEECVMVHAKCSNAPRGRSISYRIGDRGGVQWTGFHPMTAEDLSYIQKRREKGVAYDKEPLVQVFNQLVTERPGGGFWTYAELKEKGMKLLGFPPFSDMNDLRTKLNGPLGRELQEKDGLIVICGARGKGNVRGVKIEQYQVPRNYQTTLPESE